MIKFYDTYKKKLVEFKPNKKGKVGMYNCGPTVYDYQTIGNLRTYVFEDVLRRVLEYMGYEVTQVMNITDVGHLTMTEQQKKSAELLGAKIEITDTEDGLDRMEKAAKREGLSVWDIAKKYTDSFFGQNWETVDELSLGGDLGSMNVLKPTFVTKATDHVKEQIELIKKLEEKGYTYKTKEAVYSDTQKFTKYEELTGQKFSEMQKGDRANDTDEGRKHPADFRLWQLDQPGHVMQWDSPWGKGFPGWHIECSAMSVKYLGQPFDIHTGGIDHIKVHHVNEMAQSESAFDKPMANYWLHGAFLIVDGGRMGKSLGNAYVRKDIEKNGFDMLDLRYFYYSAHYRSTLNFTWEALQSAKNGRKNLINQLKMLVKKSESEGKVDTDFKEKFTEAITNDLNIPEALAVISKVLKSEINSEDQLATILDFDRVLGLRLQKSIDSEDEHKHSEAIEKLIKQRKEYRNEKDWEQADKIRDLLRDKYKVEIEDKDGETIWKIFNY